jgi:RHS repeat-associated protein
VWADLDGSNALQTRYLEGDGVDQLFARLYSGGTVASWYLTDRLGSVRDETDNTGAVQDHINYDGFGNVTSESNTGFGDRFKWTAREDDSDTGLQDNRERWDLLPVGRWTSQDSIMMFGGGDPNLYCYVHNNGVDATDPSGLKATIGANNQAVTISNDEEPYKSLSKKYKDILDPMLISGVYYHFTDAGALERNLQLRRAIIDVMKQLESSDNIGFPGYKGPVVVATVPKGSGWTFTSPPSNWNYKGPKPAEALDTLAKGPTDLDCGGRIMLSYKKGLATVMGADAYNKKYSGGVAVKYVDVREGGQIITVPGPGPYTSKFDKITKESDLVPGDWVDFPNWPEYLLKHPHGAYQSESTIYVGKDNAGNASFLAGGLGRGKAQQYTSAEIRKRLRDDYNSPATNPDKAQLNLITKMTIELTDLPDFMRVRHPEYPQ